MWLETHNEWHHRKETSFCKKMFLESRSSKWVNCTNVWQLIIRYCKDSWMCSVCLYACLTKLRIRHSNHLYHLKDCRKLYCPYLYVFENVLKCHNRRLNGNEHRSNVQVLYKRCCEVSVAMLTIISSGCSPWGKEREHWNSYP